MARGHSNQEIADPTGVSLETVRSHVKNVLQKLDQPNRTGRCCTPCGRAL